MSISVNGTKCSNIHFTGVFGSGMSAIAQFLRWKNLSVNGSDRLLDSDSTAHIRKHLLSCGCSIFPQDGSGISDKTDALCVSTAIEESNPDIATARRLNVPVVHRSDILASIVKEHKSIAVAGTSGKSTVTAMIFELLTACELSPSLISGAALRSLEQKGMLGNAFCGNSDLLVIEADESDGTLVKYEPSLSVILNLSKDHKTEDEVLDMFRKLVKQSQWSAINADDPKLSSLDATTSFGSGEKAQFRGFSAQISPLSNTIKVNGNRYSIPLPGDHNASNLLAALCVCSQFSCSPSQLARGAAAFKGVDRRFTIHQTRSGITVVDDFAHNPEKIRAAVNAARNLSKRLIAVYQPHGFAPTRFLKHEYAEMFKSTLLCDDKLCLLPIYYAGGSTVMDIKSQDLITLMGDVPFEASAVESRKEALEKIAQWSDKADCVILMGARDPSLSSFARKIVSSLGGEPQ